MILLMEELQESMTKIRNEERQNKNELMLKMQLIQSEKLASIGLLAAGVAHEINNPLAIVKGNMSILNDEIDLIQKVNTTDEIAPYRKESFLLMKKANGTRSNTNYC